MRVVLFCLSFMAFISCTKEPEENVAPKLIFRFRFDSTQSRLNSNGETAVLPAGNAAQSPLMNIIAANYIELSPDRNTALGTGAIIYNAPETTAGGDTAIDFARLQPAANNEVFYAIDIKDIPPGDYEWLRISFAYQNYIVSFRVDTTVNDTTNINQDFTGTIASFTGYNTYISSYTVKTQPVAVDTNKVQGYWGFEGSINGNSFSETLSLSGQSPEGATTVVNPLFATSPVPLGSGVATAAFLPGKLSITGTETANIVVEVSLSTNKSFEWKELVENGKWDVLKEPVVDMGIRGMIPTIK